MKKGTLFSIQYLRGIAAVIIALVHLEPRINIVLAPKGIELRILEYFGYISVDLFFIISGFVIWLTSQKISINQVDRTEIRVFFTKRCLRIYSQYLVIILSLLAVMWFLGFYKMAGLSGMDLLKIITLFPFPIDKHPLAVSWTLTYEMIFYLSFTLLLFVKGVKRRLFVLIAYCLLLLLINLYLTCIKGVQFYEFSLIMPHIPLIDPFAIVYLVSPFLLEFCLGAFICHAYLNYSHENYLFPYLIYIKWGIYLFLIISCSYLFLNKIDLSYYPLVRILIFGPILSLLVYVLVCREQIIGKNKPNQILLILGDASYSIYLLHTIFYGFLEHNTPFLQMMGNIGWWGVILVHGAFILIILISVIYSKLIELPVYQWTVKKLLSHK